MKHFLEKYLLPLAMFVGILFYRPLTQWTQLIPYLIFMMLFLTYSRVSWSSIRLSRVHYILLTIQYVGSIGAYLILRPINETLAQAVMMCVLAPTATSAPVVAGLLGGDIATVAAYSMMSNLSVALIAPFFMSVVGHPAEHLSFFTSLGYIFGKVLPVLILPFVLSILVQKISPKAHKKVQEAQIVSFYLWAVALTLVIAMVTQFVIERHADSRMLEITIALSALVVCLLQFLFGRKIGRTHNCTIAAGQSLGQKNTILAIWLTQAYLNPLASIGPGMYVLWQNLVNSYQIWRKKSISHTQ